MNKLSETGKVYIVGAGPGNPQLLTLKGQGCLTQADSVFYDALVDERILSHAPLDAQKIYVGKRGGRPSQSQKEINELMINYAQEGHCVVRLKGGDPFVFGRGAEEGIALQNANIPFEIVPGVSAAMGVTAAAGIPLTHRGLASAAVIVTGHEDPDKDTSDVEWPKLAKIDATLVIFMGIQKIKTICNRLIQEGKDPNTPAAVIQSGTTSTQRNVFGQLSDLSRLAADSAIKSPALIIVGPAVSIQQHLRFDIKYPLHGRRIMITRPLEQAFDLAQELIDFGADVYNVPMIKLISPPDLSPMKQAMSKLTTYDWLLFTSANGVNFFFQHLNSQNLDARALHNIKIATIGPATSKAVSKFGLITDLQARQSNQEGIVTAFESLSVKNARILFPSSDLARNHIVEAFGQRGAIVDQVVAYKNIPPSESELILPRPLKTGLMDWIIFTSPSTIQNIFKIVPDDLRKRIFATAHIACMGPTTEEKAVAYGLNVDVVPHDHKPHSLVQSLCNFESGK